MLTPQISGIFISLGVLIALFFSLHLFDRHPQEKKIGRKKYLMKSWDFVNALFVVFPCSFIGARTYHVFNYWNYYQINVFEIIDVQKGGLGFYGAIAGGICGLVVFSLSNKSPISRFRFIAVCDHIFLSLPLSYAVGRWGSFVTHDVIGFPSNVPWAVPVPFEYRPAGFRLFETFHPVFLYESVLNLVLFLFLYTAFRFVKRWRSDGTITLLFFLGYSLIRLFTEPLKIGVWRMGIYPVASLLSFAFLLVATILLARMYLWQLIKLCYFGLKKVNTILFPNKVV
jgi:phosphatidylglycerol:prolipoprotein diacylglycerol transferase